MAIRPTLVSSVLLLRWGGDSPETRQTRCGTLEIVDRHTLAAISVAGTTLDLLGGLYLAYDLLGGRDGPLRSLARGVTYGAMFGGGTALFLGIPFGICTGITTGYTLGREFALAARGIFPAPWRYIVWWSGVRAAGIAAGSTLLLGPAFGIAFGCLNLLGQLLGYRTGLAPTSEVEPGTRPRIHLRQIAAAASRTLGYGLAGLAAGFVARQPAEGIRFGILGGLSIGAVSAMASFLMPYIEWKVQNLPERRLGVFGAVLVVIGFVLQSVQYWVVLLDVPVN